MQEGFPIQIDNKEFLTTYEQTFSLKSTINLNILLRAIGLSRNDFKLGKTKIFFRPLKSLGDVLHPSAELISTVMNTYKKKLAVPSKWQKLAKMLLKNNPTICNEIKLKNTTKKMVKQSNPNKNDPEKGIKGGKSPVMKEIEQVQQSNFIKNDPEKDTKGTESFTSNKRPRTKANKVSKKEDMPKFKTRFDKNGHFPAADSKQVRCKLEKCSLKSSFYCMKCKVHLCIKPRKNCFFEFHDLDFSE